MKSFTCLLKKLEALYLLFQDKEVDLRLIQVTVTVEVLYIFWDASGLGFGDSWKEEYAVSLRFCLWNEEGGGTSSNYREF